MRARLSPWIKVHGVYAGIFLIFFAIFQYAVQTPASAEAWSRYVVEVLAKAAFLHAVFWIILIRPAASAWRRILDRMPGEAQRERLGREVTPVAVLDKRIQRLEEELKRREADRSSP